MDTKQKTLLILTVAAFSYLGYQVYGLMKNDMSNASIAVQSVTNNGPVAVANAAESRPLLNRNLTPPSKVPSVQEAVVHVNKVPLASGQKAYLHMINQYELAKMKRRLLEEKAAIAAAQHRIATLNKKTHEIDDSLAGAPETYDDTEGRHTAPFTLSYVDRQDGKWSATLNQEGRYFQVHIGSVLADGSKIVEINRQGVTLKKGNQAERITFNGVVKIPTENKVADNAVKPQAHNDAIHSKSNNTDKQQQYDRRIQGHVNIARAETSLLAKKKQRDIVLASAQTATKKTQNAPLTSTHKKKSENTQLSMQTKVKASKNQTKSNTRHYTEEERRILAMPKGYYSIQLIGSYHRDIVDNFAIANDLGNRAMQFYVMNRGKRWYMLLYGNYPTRQAAQKALNDLPPNLTPENPWVRTIASVQDAIRHNSGQKTKNART